MIKKASISFRTFFKDMSAGGLWEDIPDDIAVLLNGSEGSLSGITERLNQDKHYNVTITFELDD